MQYEEFEMLLSRKIGFAKEKHVDFTVFACPEASDCQKVAEGLKALNDRNEAHGCETVLELVNEELYEAFAEAKKGNVIGYEDELLDAAAVIFRAIENAKHIVRVAHSLADAKKGDK